MHQPFFYFKIRNENYTGFWGYLKLVGVIGGILFVSFYLFVGRKSGEDLDLTGQKQGY